MKTVKHILESKSPAIHAIAPDASVLDAIALMAEKGIGALVVMEGERLTGIVSERDYARKVILLGRSSRDTKVSEIMSSKVFTVSSTKTVDDCMALMTERRFRHLPVVDSDKLVGVLSIGDMVKALLADREETIKQLESYIHQ